MVSSQDPREIHLERALRSTDARSGIIVLVMACTALVASFVSLALLLVNLQQLREVTLISVSTQSRVDAIEKSRAALDGFIDETRTRLINVDRNQNYAADSFEDILKALHVAPKERPKLQPQEWPSPPPRLRPAPVQPPRVIYVPTPAPPAPPSVSTEPWWKFWN